MPRPEPRASIEPEPGETILATASASFRGAAAVSTRATFALGSSRMRRRAFDAWFEGARQAGLRRVPPDMVVALTPRRLLFGHPTFWGRAPSAWWSDVGLERVGEIVAVRHGLVTGVAVAFNAGGVVEIEALRGRRLRHLAATAQGLLPH